MRELEELAKLIRELEGRLEKLHKEKRALSRKGFTIRYVRCGRESCNVCSKGQRHGPYVYRTVRDGKKVKSVYLGKLEALKDKLNIESNLTRIKSIDEDITKIERKLTEIKRRLREIIKDVSYYNY